MSEPSLRHPRRIEDRTLTFEWDGLNDKWRIIIQQTGLAVDVWLADAELDRLARHIERARAARSV